jgi:hypothetical protein
LKAIIAALPERGVMLRVGMTNPPYILEHLSVIAGTHSSLFGDEKIQKTALFSIHTYIHTYITQPFTYYL